MKTIGNNIHTEVTNGHIKADCTKLAGSPEPHRRTDAKAPAQGKVAAQTQEQVVTQIDTLLEQLGHAPESDVDQWYAENFGMLTQEMDRLHQLLEMPTAGCEGQTAFAKKEEAL